MPQEHLQSKELESKRGGSRIDWESIATGFQECLLDSGLVSPRVKTDREVKSLRVCVSLRGRCCSRGLTRDFCVLRYAQRHRKVDFFPCWKLTLWCQLEFSPQLVWLYQSLPWNADESQVPTQQRLSAWKHVSETGRDMNGCPRARTGSRDCAAGRASSGGPVKRRWWALRTEALQVFCQEIISGR